MDLEQDVITALETLYNSLCRGSEGIGQLVSNGHRQMQKYVAAAAARGVQLTF